MRNVAEKDAIEHLIELVKKRYIRNNIYEFNLVVSVFFEEYEIDYNQETLSELWVSYKHELYIRFLKKGHKLSISDFTEKGMLTSKIMINNN